MKAVLAASLSLLLLSWSALPGAAAAAERVVVGSKAFPESWILGELLAGRARQAGASPVEHRSNLGGTEINDDEVRIVAIAEGTATLTIEHGEIQTSVEITVSPEVTQ